MRIKYPAMFLSLGLLYEILLKLGHRFTPGVFTHGTVRSAAPVLAALVGISIVLFMIAFYREERDARGVAVVLQWLMALFVLGFLWRLPATRSALDFQVQRLGEAVLGFLYAMLLFILMILYRQGIPQTATKVKQAAGILVALFGIAIVRGVYLLYHSLHFYVSRTIAVFPDLFYDVLFLLFLLTHGAMIYFLWHYARWKGQLQHSAHLY